MSLNNISSNAFSSSMMKSEMICGLSKKYSRIGRCQERTTYMGTEVLKLVNSKKFCQLFNAIYDCSILVDRLTSTIIFNAIANTINGEDYWFISLMSHVLKTFLKIINKRIYDKCEEKSGNLQFISNNNLGMREAL